MTKSEVEFYLKDYEKRERTAALKLEEMQRKIGFYNEQLKSYPSRPPLGKKIVMTPDVNRSIYQVSQVVGYHWCKDNSFFAVNLDPAGNIIGDVKEYEIGDGKWHHFGEEFV